jgi:hypothetical protein
MIQPVALFVCASNKIGCLREVALVVFRQKAQT